MTGYTTPIPGRSSTTAPTRSSRSRRENAGYLRSSGRPVTRLTPSPSLQQLPDLEIGDLVFSENIGAYSIASSTYFNGFPPAKVVNINR